MLDADLMPVTVLTGFLGSGKTTLLNRLVRQPAMRDALVVSTSLAISGSTTGWSPRATSTAW